MGEELTKLRIQLRKLVGRKCEVEFSDHQTIYGVLDSFEMTPPALILTVEGDNGLHLINFNSVKAIRFESCKTLGKTSLNNIEGQT